MYKTNRIIINAEADVFVWKKAQLYWFEKKKEPEDQWGHLALDEEWTWPRPEWSQCWIVWITIAIHCNWDLKHVSHSLAIWDNWSNVYFNRAEIHVIEDILRQLWYWFNWVHLCDNIENFVEVSFIDINKSYPFHDLAEDRS